MFLAFDAPVPFSTMGRRNVSNVPAQALTLMNDPLVHATSASSGPRRLTAEPGAIDRERLDRDSFWLRWAARPPSGKPRASLAFPGWASGRQDNAARQPMREPDARSVGRSLSRVNQYERVYLHRLNVEPPAWSRQSPTLSSGALQCTASDLWDRVFPAATCCCDAEAVLARSPRLCCCAIRPSARSWAMRAS